DPIANGQLTHDEIDRCSADTEARLNMAKPSVVIPEPKKKGPRYTPVARRQDRPDAISWMLRNYPELTDGQISKLVGTTKPTINSVRDRSHWNISNIKPRDPVSLGLCNREDLGAAIEKSRRAIQNAEKREAREKAREEREAAGAAPQTGGEGGEPAQPDAPGAPDAPSAPSAEAGETLIAPPPVADTVDTPAAEPRVEDIFPPSPDDESQEPATTEETPVKDPSSYFRPE
ncbi:MAG: cell cycle transcriptional regulator TrcR, partial [Alphaproteobacteria bacterium]